MPPRKQRKGKTADRLALYKAAMSKGRADPGSRQTPPRSSPRTKRSVPQKSSQSEGRLEKRTELDRRVANKGPELDNTNCLDNLELVPETPARETLLSRRKRAVDNTNCLDNLELVPETPPRETLLSRRKRAVDNTNCLDNLELVPETPPRETLLSRRKRVVAPRTPNSPSQGSTEDENEEESEKPSKKRKAFQTPPRVDGSAAVEEEYRQSATEKQRHRRRILDVSAPENQDLTSYDSDVFDDIEFRPPLPSARRASMHPRAPRNAPRQPERTSRIPVTRRDDVLVGHRDSSTRIRERSVADGTALDTITVSTATITRLLENFGNKIMSEVNVIHKENFAELRKIGDGLTASVGAEVQHLEGLFNMRRGRKGRHSTNTGGKTTVSEWVQKLQDLTPDTDDIFNKDLLGRLLSFNVPLKTVDVYNKYGESAVEKSATSAQTWLFSPQPGDKKVSYSGTIGSLHSELKFSVVQNAFFNVCRDSFNMFRVSSGSREPSTSEISGGRSDMERSGKSGNGNLIRRPSWLEKGKVTLDHINAARNFIERPKQSRKGKNRTSPTPDDISTHGAIRVYRLLTGKLHDGRSALRVTFSIGVGYLLVRWSDFVKDTSQRRLKMWFANDEDLAMRLEDIPYTEQCSSTAEDKTLTEVDARNKERLNKLFTHWPGMLLSVEHDVHTYTGNGGQRKHSGGTMRPIHRLINLIDVACDVCVEYCGIGSRELYLRSSRSALQCIMIFALLFKSLCIEFMEKCNRVVCRGYSTTATPELVFPEAVDIDLYGICLKDIIPGDHAQEEMLRSRCLRMPEKEYAELNQYTDARAGTVDSGPCNVEPDQVLAAQEIQESEEMGIAVI